MKKSKALDGLAWGLFIILIGIGWWAGNHYQMYTGAYIALGAGLILLGLNMTRAAMDIKISKFSLFIGIVALAMGGAGILGYALDLFPTVVILIGLFVVGEALGKLLK